MGDFNLLDRFAANQHGAFNLSQIRQAGFDRSATYRLTGNRRWLQLDHQVYALASAPSTWEQQMWAALLSRPQAVVGGRSAASLHKLRGFGKWKPEIVVPGSGNARSGIATVIRAEHFHELETVDIEGFETTTVAETLVTLAGRVGPPFLTSVAEDSLLSHKLDMDSLVTLIQREDGRRRRGINVLRRFVEERSESAPSIDASYLEGLLEHVLAEGDLPEWIREHPFTLRGQPSRVDVFIPEWKVVVEADGRTWHAKVEAFETDRQRDNELASRGIQVIRFSYGDLAERPAACLRIITETGRVRRAQRVAERDQLL